MNKKKNEERFDYLSVAPLRLPHLYHRRHLVQPSVRYLIMILNWMFRIRLTWGITTGLLKWIFPMFDGIGVRMWIDNCKTYFSFY